MDAERLGGRTKPSDASHRSSPSKGKHKSPRVLRFSLAGSLVESLRKMNGAISRLISGSNSDRTKPGAHEAGFLLSPSEKSLEKRFLEVTSLDNGLSLIRLRVEHFA